MSLKAKPSDLSIIFAGFMGRGSVQEKIKAREKRGKNCCFEKDSVLLQLILTRSVGL